MKIGVDLDSVLADFMSPLHIFHNKTYGTSYPREAYHEYDLTKVWNVDEEEVIRRVFEFYETAAFETLPPIVGAREALTNIANFHQLYLITSRPDKYHTKTLRWIRNHFPKIFRKVLSTNQASPEGHKKTTKSRICLEVGVELMIDDHIDFAFDCAAADIDVLLYDQPWNRKHKLPTNVKRMHSWKEIETYINSQK